MKPNRRVSVTASLAVTAVLAGPSRVRSETVALVPSQEPQNTGWSLFVEQDSVLSPGTDKDYTMGAQFGFGGWRIRQSLLGDALGGPQRGLDRALWFVHKAHENACPGSSPNEVAPNCEIKDDQRGYQSHSATFGVTAFTPRKGDPEEDGPGCPAHGCVLVSPDPVFDDRPYASLLFVTFRRASAMGKTAVQSDFTAGMLGLQIAKNVQTWIHGDDTDPGGWRHQISNPGEPTANYSFRFKRLLHARPIERGKQLDHAGSDPNDRTDDRRFDATVDAGASLGFYTNVGAGGRIRFGRIDTPYWVGDRQPIIFTKRPNVESTSRLRELYVWAGGGYTAWIYNALLQGQFKHTQVTLSFAPEAGDPNFASPLNRGIWDVQGGVTARFRVFGVAYQYSRHRNLFQGPHTREHAYWGIYLSFGNPDLTAAF